MYLYYLLPLFELRFFAVRLDERLGERLGERLDVFELFFNNCLLNDCRDIRVPLDPINPLLNLDLGFPENNSFKTHISYININN